MMTAMLKQLLFSDSALFAQANPPGVEGVEPNFQPYIFWAYGLACSLLFVYNLYNNRETQKLADRIQYLETRLKRAEGAPAESS